MPSKIPAASPSSTVPKVSRSPASTTASTCSAVMSSGQRVLVAAVHVRDEEQPQRDGGVSGVGAVALLEGVGEGHEVGQVGRDLLGAGLDIGEETRVGLHGAENAGAREARRLVGTIGERGRGAGDRHRQHRCAEGSCRGCPTREAPPSQGPGQHDEPDDEQGAHRKADRQTRCGRTDRVVEFKRARRQGGGRDVGRDSSSVMGLTCRSPECPGPIPEGDVDTAGTSARRAKPTPRDHNRSPRPHSDGSPHAPGLPHSRCMSGQRPRRGRTRICRTGREPTRCPGFRRPVGARGDRAAAWSQAPGGLRPVPSGPVRSRPGERQRTPGLAPPSGVVSTPPTPRAETDGQGSRATWKPKGIAGSPG